MVREDHVLQKQALFLGNAKLLRALLHLLRAHHQMADQLAGQRVIRDQPKAGKRKFLFLCKIMQQRSRQQQAPIDDLPVKPGQKIRQPQHIGRVHEKPGQKAVVDALGRRDGTERVQMPRKHRAGDGLILPVLHGVDHALNFRDTRVRVDGRGRHKGGKIILVVPIRHADAARRQLRCTLELRHLPTDLDDAADIVRPRADGAGIVPDLQIDHAGAVGQNAGQKRLSRRRRLQKRVLQNIKALYIVAGMQLGDQLVVFHASFPHCLSDKIYYISLFPYLQSYK